MVEYYSGDFLRWSFGLSNPNKAGAVLASILPLVCCLCGFGGTSGRRYWTMIAGISVLWLAALVGLLGTFSRGGLVAAIGGMTWMFWVRGGMAGPRRILRRRGRWFVLGGAMVVLALGAASWLGLFERYTRIASDASVGNRFMLWRAGLAMAHDCPGGWGAGNSGAAFMEWYQPLDRQEGYRTMVNAPLTLLVEHGAAKFFGGLLVVGTFLIWAGALPRRKPPDAPESAARWARAGASGSLITSGIAGLFTTTWEEPWVWGLMLGTGVLLGAGRLFRKWEGWNPIPAGVCSMTLCIVLAAGLWSAWAIWPWNDGLQRSHQGGMPSVRAESAAPRSPVYLMSDETVLGEQPGRMARAIALAGRGEVIVIADQGTKLVDTLSPDAVLVLCGDRIWDEVSDRASAAKVVLLSPSAGSDDADPAWTPSEIWLPQIDEDGRVEWWRRRTETEGAVIREVPGIGLRADWASETLAAWLWPDEGETEFGTTMFSGPPNQTSSEAGNPQNLEAPTESLLFQNPPTAATGLQLESTNPAREQMNEP